MNKLTETAAVLGAPASWTVFAWTWFEPFYTVLQVVALIAAIIASIATARYYFKKAKNESGK